MKIHLVWCATRKAQQEGKGKGFASNLEYALIRYWKPDMAC